MSDESDWEDWTYNSELPKALNEDQASEAKPWIVTYITPGLVRLVTNRWEKKRCIGDCLIDTQHAHVIYILKASPKRDVRVFHLKICKDKQCENKDDLHVHIKHREDRMSEEINMPIS